MDQGDAVSRNGRFVMRVTSCLLLAALVSGPSFAQSPQSESGNSGATAGRSPASQPTAADFLKMLDQRIPAVEMRDVPLSEAVDWIENATGMMVYVRWSVLKASGITPESPITVRARNRRLEDILTVILQEAQGRTNATLAYQASGEILTISTRGDLERKLITRAYDVRVLLHSVSDFRYDRKHDEPIEIERRTRTSRGNAIAQKEGAESGIVGESTGSNVRAETSGAAHTVLTTDPEFQEAVDLILNAIEPLSWDVNGGEGSIFPCKGYLIIRNNIGVHQQIEDLLGPSSVTAPK